MTKLAPGDVIIWKENPSVIRQIVDVRPTGYGWHYEDDPEKKYFLSEDSTDPFFQYGWIKRS